MCKLVTTYKYNIKDDLVDQIIRKNQLLTKRGDQSWVNEATIARHDDALNRFTLPFLHYYVFEMVAQNCRHWTLLLLQSSHYPLILSSSTSTFMTGSNNTALAVAF